MTKNYLTTKQAALLLGFCPDHVRRMIGQGKIKAEKIGNSWLIKIKDIRNIKRQREKGIENGITE